MSRRNRPTRTRATPRQTRNRLWAGGAAALGAGVLIVGPLTASAQDDDSWVDEALSGLVDDGTITQAQADAVDDALEAARPDPVFAPRGDHGRGGPWRGGGRTDRPRRGGDGHRHRPGRAARPPSGTARPSPRSPRPTTSTPQAVIDAMVAAAKVRIDEAVADGRLEATAEAGRLAEVTARITELVNEGFPVPGPHDGDHRRRGPADDDAPPAPAPPTPAPSDTTPSDAVPTTTTG